jgi:hypothetical protein
MKIYETIPAKCNTDASKSGEFWLLDVHGANAS